MFGAKPDAAHLAHLRDIGASFVALGLPPLDRDAALAAMERYAPLVAEFNTLTSARRHGHGVAATRGSMVRTRECLRPRRAESVPALMLAAVLLVVLLPAVAAASLRSPTSSAVALRLPTVRLLAFGLLLGVAGDRRA